MTRTPFIAGNWKMHKTIAEVERFVAASTIAAKSPGSRLAPPTRAPSTSGSAISSAALSGLHEPP